MEDWGREVRQEGREGGKEREGKRGREREGERGRELRRKGVR